MTFLKILNKKEKEQIEKQLNEQFGIKSIPGTLVMRGSERIFLFTGDFPEKEIDKLEKIAFIERMGVYFAKLIDKTGELRLSIEGTQILKRQISKNIFELDEKQAEEWMMGRELLIATGKHDFLVMKHYDDFLGTGKASEEKIGNFIPKNRRLRERQN